ncbi:hypothetical protein JY97_05635 [Alkalispirochaeta odontotermitis]|nr:hypothetical protein JY97_05635 [Alkalispirochaeta odontotermitis]
MVGSPKTTNDGWHYTWFAALKEVNPSHLSKAMAHKSDDKDCKNSCQCIKKGWFMGNEPPRIEESVKG